MIQGNFKGFISKFQECVKRGSKTFQGYFLEVTKGFPECLKGVLRKCSRCFKDGA